ncbi:PTS glucose/sucrose transporter subunit IIB [Lacrimispora sp.]|uniref:PTS glucose/sucrose transporter subunit IIB n=1 Tax=Lacrimispora sp. TaxID=2719234 RepID=UPI00289C32F8|nr:PTS glucose/sucrose transporter subunit IIB [Lacrimispora sp.]
MDLTAIKKKAETKGTSGTATDMYVQIVEGLGGLDNIVDLDNCATRLRVVVKDAAKADEALLKATGAAGVVQKGNNLQVIYGTKVSTIKTELEEYIEHYNRRNHNEN